MSKMQITLLWIGMAGIWYGGYLKGAKTVEAREPSTAVSPSGHTFDDLLDAIEWVESKGDPRAIGDNGNAVGSFQIWKIYVDDVNRILKSHPVNGVYLQHPYEHRLSKVLSRSMATTYLKHYGGTFEEMARKHNGGPQGHKKESTEAYWLKVKARMGTDD